MKKAFALVLALCMVFALCACGASSAKAEESYTVGVCQLVQHPALDAATEGFQAALKDKLGDKVNRKLHFFTEKYWEKGPKQG